MTYDRVYVKAIIPKKFMEKDKLCWKEKKKSDLPDLNQRPKDYLGITGLDWIRQLQYKMKSISYVTTKKSKIY